MSEFWFISKETLVIANDTKLMSLKSWNEFRIFADWKFVVATRNSFLFDEMYCLGLDKENNIKAFDFYGK
jgi:hypothetical protein